MNGRALLRSAGMGACLAVSLMNCAAASEPDFEPGALARMDRAIDAAIRRREIPGAVVHVECRGRNYIKAYGRRSLEPQKEAMTTDTIFDVASLTKVVATTPLVMRLVEQGRVSFDAPVRSYIPEFCGHGKEVITLRQLLTHSSGLAPGIPASSFVPKNYAQVIDWICRCEPQAAPGSTIIYSDLNFHLLGEIVQRVTGERIDVLARRELWEPLGMAETFWLPDPKLLPRIAPTERVEDTVLRGVVHDPTSRRAGGITAHAGLFSTASDLAKFARVMIHGGGEILQSETVASMTVTQSPVGLAPERGLGWEIRPVFDRAVEGPPPGTHLAYGHTGWTGTSLWIDPARDLFVILLTNRNHPSGGDAKPIRRAVADLATEAVRPLWAVKNGIDVLADENFATLAGLRIGLITNHTGRSAGGVSTIDLLAAAPGVKLSALFSPEHGIRGELDQEKIADGKDSRTGLPVYSLYGETRQPLASQLVGLDALVFDIQDAGCRFYTYVSTMGLAMEMAARHGLRFIVLDRVNPLGGEICDGPGLTSEARFTSFHPVAVRHGMTAGELARMFVSERKLDLQLTVVPLRHWSRAMTFNETGLPWINPSPNLRNLSAATLYPGIGLLEFLNLSVGRGTPAPFELVGAPWIDGKALAAALAAERFPGLRIEAASFTPESSVFAGERCGGVRLTVTDRHSLPSIDVGFAIARYLAARHAEEAKITEKLNFLLCHPVSAEAVRRGDSIVTIRDLWRAELEAFRKRRAPFLLY